MCVLLPTCNVLQIATCIYLLYVDYRTDCFNWGPRQYNILPTYHCDGFDLYIRFPGDNEKHRLSRSGHYSS
jgi:hypothetical protein